MFIAIHVEKYIDSFLVSTRFALIMIFMKFSLVWDLKQ